VTRWYSSIGLPKAAFDALVERVAVLEPWDAAVISPANDPAYRRTVFGAGYGLLSFRADEAAEVIRISTSSESAEGAPRRASCPQACSWLLPRPCRRRGSSLSGSVQMRCRLNSSKAQALSVHSARGASRRPRAAGATQ
jgi:hypothetical protein